MQPGNTPTLLLRAPVRLNGSFCYAADDDQGGTQDQTPEPVTPPKGKAKGGKEEPTDPDTITLTRAELKAQIGAAVAERDRKAEDKAKKDREAAEADEAKKRGEFEKVASAEKDRADKAEARALAAERSTLVNDAFAEVLSANEGLSLAALNKWVRPNVLAALTADTEPADVTKQAKQLATDYAKENPPKTKGRAGVPGDMPNRLPARPSDKRGENGEPQFNGAAARF